MNIRQMMVIFVAHADIKNGKSLFIGNGAKFVINDSILLAWLFSIISAIFIVFLLNADSRACVNHDLSPTLHNYKRTFKFIETKF